ncbi:MAG: ABC transporter substrate-binding protein [Marinobacter sp. 34-60-7]|nr:MAG: ABC transporter substrate-binding protein [Marinobacter sp. 34-60-7]
MLSVRAVLGLVRCALCLGLFASTVGTAAPNPANWPQVERAARGQRVYFNAWAGEPKANDYIAWAAAQIDQRYGIHLVHVKLADTGTAVARVLAERQAGNTANGAVDLLWVNGENFAALKNAGLLYGPWAEQLPNFHLTDADNNPAVRTDFTVPVEGYEAPWGKAQLVFYYDADAAGTPPRSIAALLPWARQHRGQFSYVRPPQFLGTTFLKQALLELAGDRQALYAPVGQADFAAVTAPLWDYLDALHPYLWRSGRAFPDSGPALRRLLADGELSLAYTFNPNEVAAGIASHELPTSVHPYVLDAGSIGNVSFLAIPFNARHKAAAMVVANFLLSPEAQARKQDPRVWGSATVLSLTQLDAADRARFTSWATLPDALPATAASRVLAEPHPSWVAALEQAWLQRYVGR